MRFWSCSAIPIVAGHFVLLSMCWEIKLFYIYTFCFLFASLWMRWTPEQAVPKQLCPLRLTGPRFVRMLFLYSVLDGSMTSGNRNELCSILTLWQLDVTTETDSVNLKYVDLSLVRMNFMPHSHSHGLFSRCAVVIAVSVWHWFIMKEVTAGGVPGWSKACPSYNCDQYVQDIPAKTECGKRKKELPK